VCKCGYACRDETDTHPLRCPRYGSNCACHNAALQFVKSLARDAGYHAPKGDVCERETTPALKRLRADGIILFGDEDCSKLTPTAPTPLLFLIFRPAQTSSMIKFLQLTSPRRRTNMVPTSTLCVPPFLLWDSRCLARSVKNSGLYSIDSHKQYLSVSKILSVDH
jgi:hypothetical protein